MELDDFKQHWQRAGKVKNNDIKMIMQNKRTGPLAELKRSFKRQIIAMIMVVIFILATNLQHIEKTLSSALFWFYVLFCLCVCIFARINYNLVKRMEVMDGMVKTNLEQQILLLQRRLKQNLIGIRVALLLFIVLTEVLPYFQYFRMLHTWNSLSPFIRFGAYAALFLFQYFISRRVSQQKFGKHIAHLKELVKQME